MPEEREGEVTGGRRQATRDHVAVRIAPRRDTFDRMPAAAPPPPRILIEDPQPSVDAGRYAAKRVAGDDVTVSARIFRDGHDLLRAVARVRPKDATARWLEVPMAWIDR